MQTKEKIRVLVVDDSTFMRKVLVDILNKDSRLEVVGTAEDGAEAVIRTRDLKPDVITLDINMPNMDGKRALRRIMSKHPTPVVLVSAYTKEGTVLTLECLDMGAVDFIQKPSGEVSSDLPDIGDDIIEKIVAAADSNLKTPKKTMSKSVVSDGFLGDSSDSEKKVVVIGTSTGGPTILDQITGRLDKNLTVPIIIAQHMPGMFVGTFAERLDGNSKIKVRQAKLGEELKPGVAYLAPGDCNTKFKELSDPKGDKIVFDCEKKDTDKKTIYPSVDELFTSAAEVYGEGVLGVVLTGMGSDGKKGVEVIKKAGGKTLAQDEDSSLIYGMPKEAQESGCIDKVMDPFEIADTINSFGQ